MVEDDDDDDFFYIVHVPVPDVTVTVASLKTTSPP